MLSCSLEIWLEVRKFRLRDERKQVEKMKVIHSELSKWHDDREEFAAYLESLNVEENWEDVDGHYDEDAKAYVLQGKRLSLSDISNMLMFGMNTQQMMDASALRFR